MIGSLKALIGAFKDQGEQLREQSAWMRETINRQQDQMIEMRRDGFQFYPKDPPSPDQRTNLPPQVQAAIQEHAHPSERLEQELWAAGELMANRDPEDVIDEIVTGQQVEPFD